MDKIDNLLKTFGDLILKVDEERSEYVDYIERCRLNDMKEIRRELNEIKNLLKKLE